MYGKAAYEHLMFPDLACLFKDKGGREKDQCFKPC